MIRELVRVITVAIVAVMPGVMAPAYVAPAEAAARSPAYENAAVLAGNGLSYGYAIVEDKSGNVFIAGKARDINWPVKPAVFGGAPDKSRYYAYVARLDSALSMVLAVAILNGSGNDAISGISLDRDGNIVVLGDTSSVDLAGTANSKGSYRGKTDVFVARLTPDLDRLLSLKLLGGTDYDYGRAMLIAPSGDIYVTGVTGSGNFPVTPGAYQTGLHEPRVEDEFSYGLDAFITRLSPGLDRIEASTLYGKIEDQHVYGIAMDEKQNIYIAGTSFGEGVVVTPGVDIAGGRKGLLDLFVAKFDAGLTRLVAATSWGGTDQEYARGILVRDGFVYLSGYSRSMDFPWTQDALQRRRSGDVYDTFIVKITDDLSEIVYSSLTGGLGLDFNRGVRVSSSGNVVLFGNTNSDTTFPRARVLLEGSGVQGDDDFFISVLDAHLKPLRTFIFGGRGREQIFDAYINGSGDVLAIGTSTSEEIEGARQVTGPIKPRSLNVLVVRLKIFDGVR